MGASFGVNCLLWQAPALWKQLSQNRDSAPARKAKIEPSTKTMSPLQLQWAAAAGNKKGAAHQPLAAAP